MDLNVRVQPKFIDGECSIEFLFSFDRENMKIGEANILTCEEEMAAQLIEEEPMLNPKKRETNYPKIAFVTDLVVMDGHKTAAINEIEKFLSVIGIQKIQYEHNQLASLA